MEFLCIILLIQVNEDLVKSKFVNDAIRNASRYNWQVFSNETVKRMFWKITNVGPAALSNLEKVKRVMSAKYTLRGEKGITEPKPDFGYLHSDRFKVFLIGRIIKCRMKH